MDDPLVGDSRRGRLLHQRLAGSTWRAESVSGSRVRPSRKRLSTAFGGVHHTAAAAVKD